MEQANKHLPRRAARPTVILFTDGKHDVAGVPASQVIVARNKFFGARSPFALLPVGMGLESTGREALMAGLEDLRVVHDMPACVDGATFDWPSVVFDSAEEAGNAVAVALQDATCTFTAGLVPLATPPLTGAGIPGVQGIRLSGRDGVIEVALESHDLGAGADRRLPACAAGPARATGSNRRKASRSSRQPRSRAWPTGPRTNARSRRLGRTGQAPGRPRTARSRRSAARRPRPSRPSRRRTARSSSRSRTTAQPAWPSYRVECSGDNGATWPVSTEVSTAGTPAQVGGLANGIDYRCRAFAANSAGVSDASPLSDLIRPCGSVLECRPYILPLVGGLGALLALGLLAAFFALYRGRTHGYVVAVVDIVHTANIGHGANLGIGFVFHQTPGTRSVTGIVADKGKKADIRIRRLRGGRFAIRDRTGRQVANDGEAVDRVRLNGRPTLAHAPGLRDESGIAGGEPALAGRTPGPARLTSRAGYLRAAGPRSALLDAHIVVESRE